MSLSPRDRILVIIALTGLILSQGYSLSSVAKSKTLQDFLPPVANINGKIESKTNNSDNPEDIGTITLSQVTPKTIKTSQPILKLDNDLGINTSNEEFQTLMAMQRTLDAEDLKKLWNATVEKNPVIRFSLEKLSAPPDTRNRHSSMFVKTLNMMISGGMMAGSMFAPVGTGDLQRMGVMALGDAARNIVNGNTKPQVNALSATEQIQLASLVDELQEKLVHSYHDYKNTLQALIPAHQTTVKNNSLYSKAIASSNQISILAAGAAYYKSLLNETDLRQKAKLYRLALERMAGEETVAKLELSLSIAPDLTQQAVLETKAVIQAPDKPHKKESKKEEESPPVPLPNNPATETNDPKKAAISEKTPIEAPTKAPIEETPNNIPLPEAPVPASATNEKATP